MMMENATVTGLSTKHQMQAGGNDGMDTGDSLMHGAVSEAQSARHLPQIPAGFVPHPILQVYLAIIRSHILPDSTGIMDACYFPANHPAC